MHCILEKYSINWIIFYIQHEKRLLFLFVVVLLALFDKRIAEKKSQEANTLQLRVFHTRSGYFRAISLNTVNSKRIISSWIFRRIVR